MEPFIARLIINPNMPKWLRYAIAAVIFGLIIFLGIMLLLKSPMISGKIFGGILSVIFILTAAYLFLKIAKSSK